MEHIFGWGGVSKEDLRESVGWEEGPNGKGEGDNLKEWEINTSK